MAEDLLRRPAHALRGLIGRGELSAVELVEMALARHEQTDAAINALVTVSPTALGDARAIDARLARGEDPGPLAGLPVGIKDITPVAGLRCTYGSAVYADHVAIQDAEIVRRLRAAGAVILGKTNTPEFATGGNTFNEVFGPTRNPWNPALSAGGSTGGGAAALATGAIALAEGTDLGGSLRIPASFCGIVGLRPSIGLVPTWPNGHAWDVLQVSGPMARTAEDVALALQVMAGASPTAPLGVPASGRDFLAAARAGLRPGAKLAWCADPTGLGVDPRVAEICRAAAFDLRDAGAEVEEIELDLSAGRRAFLTLRAYWMIAHHTERLEHLERFGPNLKGNIEAGLRLTGAALGEAEAERSRIWHAMRELFERFDALLTPCMVIPPFPVEQNYPETIAGKPMSTYIDWVASTFVFSLTGLPVASVPCGLDAARLPVGLQIIAPPLGEEAALGMAKTVQEMRPIGSPDLARLG